MATAATTPSTGNGGGAATPSTGEADVNTALSHLVRFGSRALWAAVADNSSHDTLTQVAAAKARGVQPGDTKLVKEAKQSAATAVVVASHKPHAAAAIRLPNSACAIWARVWGTAFSGTPPPPAPQHPQVSQSSTRQPLPATSTSPYLQSRWRQPHG